MGGHCISVNPYYLSHKASQLGYHPEVVLSGRRVNDRMAAFIVSKTVKLLIKKDIQIYGAQALILGVTFKENCPDFRNTKVIDIYNELVEYIAKVDIYNPWADEKEVFDEYKVEILQELINNKKYEAIIVAVAHSEFLNLDLSKIIEYNQSFMIPKNA